VGQRERRHGNGLHAAQMCNEGTCRARRDCAGLPCTRRLYRRRTAATRQPGRLM
jgi:hypothetical protein